MAVHFARISYGTMNLTWKPEPTPDDRAFEVIKAAIDGADSSPVQINADEFYAMKPPTANLSLLSRFFAKHPSYAEKVVLSVKGGLQRGGMTPDASPDNLKASVETINEKLLSEGGKKKMDMFEMARVDPKVSIEDTMKTLLKLRNEGHFKYISLSECSAKTINRAAAVGPVSAVEVEYSLWSRDIESNGVLDACRKHRIPIVAYSPLGRGFLTGKIKKVEDLGGDMRTHLDRFKPENFEKNLKLVEKVETFAQKKGVTPAQVALAWLLAQDPLVHPIPGSTRPEGVKESLAAIQVELSKDELKELRSIVESVDVQGGRYWKDHEALLEG